MSKGFGQSQKPTEKEVQRFKRFIEQGENYDAFLNYQAELFSRYGRDSVNQILSTDPDLFERYLKFIPGEAGEKARQAFDRTSQDYFENQIVRWGFEPGKDFSVGVNDSGEKVYYLSDSVVERFKQDGFDPYTFAEIETK